MIDVEPGENQKYFATLTPADSAYNIMQEIALAEKAEKEIIRLNARSFYMKHIFDLHCD